MRKPVRADPREFPRYDVKLKAPLEYERDVTEIVVHEMGEGGARIMTTADITMGDMATLIFPGTTKIAGEIVRIADDGLAVHFSPAQLRHEELRDLVTAPGRAASSEINRRSCSCGATALDACSVCRSRSHDL